MRKVRGVLLAVAIVLPIGLLVGPAGSATTGLTCTKLGGTVTWSPAVPAAPEDSQIERHAQGHPLRLHGHDKDREWCDRPSRHQDDAGVELHPAAHQAAEDHANRRVDHLGHNQDEVDVGATDAHARRCRDLQGHGQGREGSVRGQDAHDDRRLHPERLPAHQGDPVNQEGHESNHQVVPLGRRSTRAPPPVVGPFRHAGNGPYRVTLEHAGVLRQFMVAAHNEQDFARSGSGRFRCRSMQGPDGPREDKTGEPCYEIGLTWWRRLQAMGMLNGNRRTPPAKRHGPTRAGRNDRVSVSPRMPESFLKKLLRSPPRRTGGNPG